MVLSFCDVLFNGGAMAEFFDEAAKKPLLLYVPSWIHPNHLSVLRALLAIPVVIFNDKPVLAITFLVLSSILDLLDGPLARVRGQKSNLGAWLDSTADKVFVLIVIYGGCFARMQIPIIVTVTALEVALVLIRVIKERRGVSTDSNQFGAIKTWSQSFALAFLLTWNSVLEMLSTYVFIGAIAAAALSFVFHTRDFRRSS